MSLSDLTYTPRSVASRPRDRRYGAPVQQSVEKARQKAAMGMPQTKPDNKHLASDAWKPLPGSTPIALLERTGCWWPVGPSGPQRYCDMPIVKGHYCEGHSEMMRSKEKSDD